MKDIFFLIVSFSFFITHAQTKVGGIVIDEQGEPVSFANVFFKNSTEGTITNDDGRFYLESETD